MRAVVWDEVCSVKPLYAGRVRVCTVGGVKGCLKEKPGTPNQLFLQDVLLMHFVWVG